MALGLRVSNDEAVNSVALDTNFQIHFMPENLPVEEVRNIQRNFQPWIIGNGLRELDQATSIFADKVYQACILVEFHRKKITQEAIDKIASFENRTNVAGKLQKIAEEFGIDTTFRVHMPSLSKARNALTHNMGIVGERHCTDDGELRLTWMGFELVIGQQVVAGDFEPIQVEAGQTIIVRTIVRSRTIPINTAIELSPHDLHEICLTYWVQAQKIVRKLSEQTEEIRAGATVKNNEAE